MEIYLVGGAVRDQLLKLPIKERDWVVVGATPQMMIDLGYRPVGKDFPVFLHPETHEEYALARTERKTAPGYKGFNFYAAPEVTLEEDLQRRDLTINAIAQTSDGALIDPFNGQEDIRNKIFRHVSTAFIEDPVRILRIARFAARFPDFVIAEETLALMKKIVKLGEMDALVPERVWQEWARAMQENAPQKFFSVLSACEALSVLFPELQNNNEGLLALTRAAEVTNSALIRFAVLVYKLEKKSLEILLQRYRVPRDYQELALLVVLYHEKYFHALELNAQLLLKLLESVDAFRRSERFEQFLLSCEIIYSDEKSAARSERLRAAYLLTKSVDPEVFVQRGLTGADVGRALQAQRVVLLEKEFSIG